MDEQFWKYNTDPLVLLSALHPQCTLGSDLPQSRAARMYLLACARRQWHRMPGVCRALLFLTEVFADSPREYEPLRVDLERIAERLLEFDTAPGPAIQLDLSCALLKHDWAALRPALNYLEEPAGDLQLSEEIWRSITRLIYLPLERNTPVFQWVSSEFHSLEVLRDVFGNPYRRVSFSASWRTSTTTALARTMYDSREFTAMPILADALQDAGCDQDAILEHCRKPGEHVRGCWVVDQILKLR